jgi:hypothetical protein
MTNVIKFPGRSRPPPIAVSPTVSRHDDAMKNAAARVVGGIQLVLALLWPLLRWVLAIDVAWQFFRMLYLWKAADAYAGWTFALHFVVFVALLLFVSSYKPRRL